jgi:hypothetical protein
MHVQKSSIVKHKYVMFCNKDFLQASSSLLILPTAFLQASIAHRWNQCWVGIVKELSTIESSREKD